MHGKNKRDAQKILVGKTHGVLRFTWECKMHYCEKVVTCQMVDFHA